MFSLTDTIAAIATPRGRGGVGVVRVSGPASAALAASILDLRSALLPRYATHTRVVADAQRRETVDEVVATWFPGPHSYTGEDVVEVSGHGSPVLLERILALLLAGGARLAGPGEFTLRAYLHGRIDLVQAEAVNDLVNAATPRQAHAAMDQLDGTLSGSIGELHHLLFDAIAKCEGSLDFPEEGFHFFEVDELRHTLERMSARLAEMLSTARRGRLIREGRVVAIVGRPNVGKSTLFNALLGRNRAIVTDVPGTTRDLLSEPLDVNGIPVTLVDTAGIRDSTDAIEREGIARAESIAKSADVILLLLDGSEALTPTDRALLNDTDGMTRIVAVTKTDLPMRWDAQVIGQTFIATSAREGVGLDQLRDALTRDGSRDAVNEAPAVTNIRHIGLLNSAREAITRALAGLAAGATEEMVLVDLHEARAHLEAVTGTRTIDDVLHHIFANFCIGK